MYHKTWKQRLHGAEVEEKWKQSIQADRISRNNFVIVRAPANCKPFSKLERASPEKKFAMYKAKFKHVPFTLFFARPSHKGGGKNSLDGYKPKCGLGKTVRNIPEKPIGNG